MHSAPTVGFDQPFERLLACHQRVQRMRALMEWLALHLAGHGPEPSARQAAQDRLKGQAYPTARRLLDGPAQAAMGGDMALRRGARWTAP